MVIERGIDGREIEVAVLGNDEPQASVPGEIIPHREFYDYAAEISGRRNQARDSREAEPRAGAAFQEYAVRAFRSLECSGMARVDFFLEKTGGVS